jgi:hypothetical protein
MLPRVVAVLTFLAVVTLLNLWGRRRDRLSGLPFELRAPPEFQAVDRAEAAVYVAEGDPDKASALAAGGQVFLRYGQDDDDRKYTEVVEVSEDDYPIRPGEHDRSALFGRSVIEIGKDPVKVLSSEVRELGGKPVIIGKLEAEVSGQPVRLLRYVMATDRGRATVDTWCLTREEGRYRPVYEAMIATARGVAVRPERLPWYWVSLIAGGASLAAFVLTHRLRRPAAALDALTPSRREDDER